MSWITVILLIFMYPILPVIYVMLKNETKPKKNIILGITIPISEQNSEHVNEICTMFKRKLKVCMVILTVALVPAFFVPYMSISFSILMVWVVAVIAVMYGVYIKYYKKLRSVKMEMVWLQKDAGTVPVDLTALSKLGESKPSILSLVLPVIVSAVPVVLEIILGAGKEEHIYILSTAAIMLVITATFPILSRIAVREKMDIIDENSDINLALTRIRRRNWAVCWKWLAWLTAVYSVLLWIFIGCNTWLWAFMAVTLVYSIAIILIAVNTEMKTRRAQQKISEKSVSPVYTDSDSQWIYGIFYYNPNDKKIMKQNRVGIGATVNMATKTGKGIIAFSVLCIVAMLFLCVWIIKEEFTPIELKLNDGYVVSEHLYEEYRIDLADVKSIDILYQLPRTSKVAGTDMDSVLKGRFRVDGYGVCDMCINPGAPPFIVITTEDGYTFLNSADADETICIYNNLLFDIY